MAKVLKQSGHSQIAVQKGGRRPDLLRWEGFWMAVVQIARDGELVPGQINSQAELRDQLLRMVGDDGLSEDSIKDPVRRMWNKFYAD